MPIRPEELSSAESIRGKRQRLGPAYRLKCLLSVADATRRVLESLCYWQFRECEQTFHEQLTVTLPRGPPCFAIPFTPIIRHLDFPAELCEPGCWKSLERCLIAFAARNAAEISRPESRGRASRCKYQFPTPSPKQRSHALIKFKARRYRIRGFTCHAGFSSIRERHESGIWDLGTGVEMVTLLRGNLSRRIRGNSCGLLINL